MSGRPLLLWAAGGSLHPVRSIRGAAGHEERVEPQPAELLPRLQLVLGLAEQLQLEVASQRQLAVHGDSQTGVACGGRPGLPQGSRLAPLFYAEIKKLRLCKTLSRISM